jgi:hypothetical protein
MRNLRTPCLALAMLTPLLSRGEGADESTWRDPFWPVGYVPRSARSKPAPVVKTAAPRPKLRVVEQPKPVVDWKAARRRLKISGYAEANGIRSCFVNGRLVSEGEIVSLVNQGLRYGWRVERIDPEPAKGVFEELEVRPVEGGKR